jgi:xanthine dehydrogenase YagR molybdenum-binding subunit
MSILQKAIEAVVRRLPDRFDDPLIEQKTEVGQPRSRVDGRVKVSGSARFAAEVPYPNLTYGAVVYSNIARGKISQIDTTEADQAPGVVFIMTHLNAPRMKSPPTMDEGGVAASTLPVMQSADICWNGQPIALVVAETQEQADYGASLVCVTYDAQPHLTEFQRARENARSPGDIVGEPADVHVGDAEAALRAAAFRVDHVYRTPRHSHSAIELHAVTVEWRDGRLIVHDTTQAVNLTRTTLAKVFGLAEDKVRILSPFVGGGFGNKTLWNHHIIAVAAAKEVGRPVRVVLSREGVFRSTGGRTLTEQRVALGANADGPLAALIHTGIAGMTTHNNCPEQFTFPARHLYAAETLKLEQRIADLDMVPNTWMRAPGESVGTFALDSAIDELAVEMDIDPIDLRRRIEPDTDPASGLSFSSRHLIEAYERGAERFGWSERGTPGARREGDWVFGMGVGTATYPYYRMPGGSARICLFADGRAVVQMAAHEMGMGTATAQAQATADRLAMKADQVTFEYGDTDLPSGTIAGGSSQTASIAAAVMSASDVLFKELLKLAGNDSPLAGLKASEIIAADGGLASRTDPVRRESYISILQRAGREELAVEAAASMPLEIKQYSMHSYGAQFCELKVNQVTGEVRVTRWLGSFDTGRIINPKTAASQFRGGIIMGLGLALMEETLFDERTGRIMNPSLAEYHIPSHLDVPEIDVIWNDIPDPRTPLGLRGIGEIGITGVGAAVANAVFNATGKRIRELPITLDKLM